MANGELARSLEEDNKNKVDEELITFAKNGEQQALEELFRTI